MGIITLSGKPGAGKSKMALILAKELGYKSYSMGDMKGELAIKKGMTIDEFMDKCSPKEVHRKVDDFQRHLGETSDNFVMDSWAGWHFIPNSFKIYMDVDWDIAAKRVYNDKRHADEPKYKNIGECKEIIIRRYETTRDQIIEEYNERPNIDNKKNYDAIIDTSHRTPEQISNLIIKAIKNPY